METSASCEARSAPSSYPTGHTIEKTSGYLAAASISPCGTCPIPNFSADRLAPEGCFASSQADSFSPGGSDRCSPGL